MEAVVEGNSFFAQQLYNILSKQDGNILFSPLSAHALLSMCFLGAKGTTYDAFTGVLHIADSSTAAEGYKDVLGSLANIPNVQLSIANKIYIMQGFSLSPAYKQITQTMFFSDIEEVNFGNAIAVAKHINEWVGLHTKNKIKHLITPDMVSDLTKLVLVNAIYFKGNWASRFDANLTTVDKFYLNDKDSVDVSMMWMKGKYFYKEDGYLDAKVLELPYANPNLSLYIVLPNKRNGISDLEKKLATVTSLRQITEDMFKPEVIVKLPKFRMETTIELDQHLKNLGLGNIFDGTKADFSGMLTDSEPVCVSKVIHKAFIEVNEEGTEAAAATGIVVMYRKMPAVRTFTADQPFIILLQTSHACGFPLILFVGRVSKP